LLAEDQQDRHWEPRQDGYKSVAISTDSLIAGEIPAEVLLHKKTLGAVIGCTILATGVAPQFVSPIGLLSWVHNYHSEAIHEQAVVNFDPELFSYIKQLRAVGLNTEIIGPLRNFLIQWLERDVSQVFFLFNAYQS